MPTLDIAVAASSDDAGQTNTTMSLTATNIRINAATVRAGFRFLNVTVPAAATIDVAYITVERGSAAASPNVTIACEDVDDAATFTTTANDISTRPVTTATVTWNAVLGGVTGDRFNSPSIVAPVQEVIDRGGWASGNDLNVLFFGVTGGDIQIRTWDNAVADAAALHIEYTTGGAGPIAGTAAITLDALTVAATALLALSGSASLALGTLTLAASATLALSAAASVVLGELTLSAAGNLVTPGGGSASIQLEPVTLVSTGELGEVPVVDLEGQAAILLGELVLVVVSTLAIAGNAAITLGNLTLVASEVAPVLVVEVATIYGPSAQGRVVAARASVVIRS